MKTKLNNTFLISSFIIISLSLSAFYIHRSFLNESSPDTDNSSDTEVVKGYLNIDLNGEASYSMGILCPPGTHDLSPNLSIVYNSQQNNGLLGNRFALNGLSKISRTAATVAQDGFRGGINYDQNDRFNLDGKRLININQVSGGYAGDGAIYHTELESWTKVVARGDTCGAGPCYFEVTLKDGTQLEYGVADDARIKAVGDRFASGALQGAVRTWLLNKVTDLNGNSLVIKYSLQPKDPQGQVIPNTSVDDGQYYPDQIQYTIHNNLSAQRFINFAYEARPDTLSEYQGGAKIKTKARLVQIQSTITTPQNATEPVFTYIISYDSSAPLQCSRIQQITEMGVDGASTTPTQFNWTNGPDNFYARPSNTGKGLQENYGWGLIGDFNGDGLTDLINNNLDSVYYGNYSGLQKGIHTGISVLETTSLGDFNGDGLTDVITLYNNGNGDIYWANRQGFVKGPSVSLSTFNCNNSQGCAQVADFNGDGISDLFAQNGYSGFVYLFGGDMGLDTTLSISLQPNNSILADFNGDGMTDIMNGTSSGVANLYLSDLSKSNTFQAAISVNGFNLVNNCSPSCNWTADFNGDGLADILARDGTGGPYELFYSNGYGFEKEQPLNNLSQYQESFWLGDYNGDHLMDLYLVGNQADTLFYSNGSGFEKQVLNNQNLLNKIAYPGDFNGDGATDLFYLSNNQQTLYASSGSNTSAMVHNQAPNLITSIDNGIGGEYQIQYQPLTDTTIYFEDYTNTTDYMSGLPLFNNYASIALSSTQAPTRLIQDVQNSMYVVAAYSKADGRGNEYAYSFHYSGAKTNLNGRGWLGFRSKTLTDSSVQTHAKTYYNQGFPFTGTVDTTLVSTLSNQLMQKSYTSYQSNIGALCQGDTCVYQVTTKSNFQESYTYGQYNYTQVQYYNYDNYGNVILTKNLGDIDKSPPVYTFNSYYNDTSAWQLGYQTASLICADSAKKDTLGLSQYFYNSSTRNLDSLREWDNSQQSWLTTIKQYDTYGNIISIINPSQDTQTTQYDHFYHCFPVSKTYPRANGIQLSDSAGYDPRFGSRTFTIDVNGNKMTYLLDGFGGTKAINGPMPDQAGTTMTLESYQWQLTGQAGFCYISKAYSSWDSQNYTVSEQYHDGLGRNYKTISYGVSAGDTAKKTITIQYFDSQDRVIKNSLPYFENADSIYWQSTSYDPYGRTARMVTPQAQQDSTVVVFNYNGYNVTTTKAYGTPDSSSSTAIYTLYNSSPKLTQRITPNDQNKNKQDTTSFEYNPLGQLTRSIDPKGINNRYTYNTLGRMIQVQSPSRGQINWDYDEKNKITTITNAIQQKTKYQYDPLGRIVSINYNQQDSVFYSYDQASHSNGLGNLCNIEMYNAASQYQYSFAYNDYGQLIADTLTIDQEKYSSAHSYAPNGQLLTMTYPDGSILQNCFNKNNLLDSVNLTDNMSSSLKNMVSYQNYNALGEAQIVQYGNKTISNYSYFPSGNVASYQLSDATQSTITNQEYQLDHQFRITKTEDKLNANYSQSFYYSSTGRLDSAYSDYGPKKYQYDASGNLLLKDGIQYSYNNYQVQHGVNSANNSTVTHFKYDSLGNMTKKIKGADTFDIRYNLQNQIDSIYKNGQLYQSCNYDSRGQRIEKIDYIKQCTTRYISAVYEITLYGSDSSEIRKYIPGSNGKAASITTKSTSVTTTTDTLYFHQDYIGSTGLTTDEQGLQASKVRYTPFGQIYEFNGPDNFTYKYTGQELDQSTGFYYYNARYYDPEIGHFTSADDQFGGDQHQSDILNCYAYTLNNPVNKTDPTGHNAFSKIASSIIDAGEIVAGVALDAVGLEPIGGALIGGGVAGLQYSLSKTISGQSFSWKSWGEQEAVGVVLGLVTDGLSALKGASEGTKALEKAGGDLAECTEEGQCFVAGTKIATQAGTKDIENITVGDWVWAYNEQTGKKSLQKVVNVFVKSTDAIMTIHVNGQVIESTEEHPFRVEGEWKAAGQLRTGDLLTTLNGEQVKVSNIQSTRRREKVYNFEVDQAHTYYVHLQDFAVLVHNICLKKVQYGSTDLSKEVLGQRFKANDFSGRNYAALEYEDDLGNTKRLWAKSGRFHSEKVLKQELDHLKIGYDRVTRLYTEREPCSYFRNGGGCKKMLEREFNKNLEVTYSFEYGDKPSRTRGNKVLRNTMKGYKTKPIWKKNKAPLVRRRLVRKQF